MAHKASDTPATTYGCDKMLAFMRVQLPRSLAALKLHVLLVMPSYLYPPVQYVTRGQYQYVVYVQEAQCVRVFKFDDVSLANTGIPEHTAAVVEQ